MCLRPIRIYNNSKYVNLHDFDVFRYCACGNCVECQFQKQTEYALRAYYEHREVLKNHGFVYWDMLSYSPEYVPKSFGFECFRKKHVQNFIRNMRRQLEYHFHVDKDAFRYLVCSEYGDIGHHPHYHILFFVHTNKISVRDFHTLIHKCWPFGVTNLENADNVYNGLVRDLGCCTNYVTKYICKENDFALQRLNEVNDILNERGYTSASMKNINKRFQPFHLCSKGFGSYYLDLVKDDDKLKLYKEDLEMFFPTRKQQEKKVSIPLYYQRKLFYSLVVNPDGTQSWVLNADSKQFMQGIEKKAFDKAVSHNFDIIKSMTAVVNMCKDDVKLAPKVENFISLFDPVTENLDIAIRHCLSDRSVADFTSYVRYYKGRVVKYALSTDAIIESRLSDSLNPLAVDYQLDNIISDPSFKKGKRTKHAKRLYVVVPDYDIEVNDILLPNPMQPDIIPDAAESAEDQYLRIKAKRVYYKGCSIDENTFPEFRDFDKLYNFILDVRKSYSIVKDISEKQMRDARRKLAKARRVPYNNS